MRRTDGFSLIEILMAVLIAGTVAAIAIPVFNGQRNRAKDRAAATTLDTAIKAARSVHSSTEDYPADVATRIANTESTLNASTGTGFAQGQVQIERRTADEIALRTQSRSGVNLLWVDNVTTGRTLRSRINNAASTVVNEDPNPSVETNTTGWYPWPGTGGTNVTSGTTTASAYVGARSFEETVIASQPPCVIAPGNTQVAVTPGETISYRAAAQVVSGSFSNLQVRLNARFTDASGTWLIGVGLTSRAASLGEWVELSGTMTVPSTPAGIKYTQVEMYAMGVQPSTVVLRADGYQITRTSSPPAYIDGDRPGGAWTGTPHASTSTGYDAAPMQ